MTTRTLHEYYTKFGVNSEKVISAKLLVSNAKKIARTMSASYNQKKKAFESAKTSYHSSGALDISRIHSYRTSDDIFLKNSILKEGTSHGLICALDYSMSMRNMIPKMAIQFLITSLFCKYSDIKFTFFTFTTGNSQLAGMPLDEGKAIFTDVGNDRMSEKQLIDIFYHMLSYYELLEGLEVVSFTAQYTTFLRKSFKMSMTPLHAAVFQSYLLAKQMKDNGVQNVTILIINDGDNNEEFDGIGKMEDDNFYGSIEDPYSKRIYNINDNIKKKLSSNMLISPMNRMIRDSGIKIINMYLGDFTYVRASNIIEDYVDNTDTDTDILSYNKHTYDNNMVTKMYTEINNLCYYNTVLIVNVDAFPDLKETTKLYDSNVISNHTQKIKSLTLIGKHISDKMVEDFKIKQ